MVSSFNSIKQQVAHILEKYPEARDSDKYLIVMFLKEFYDVQAIEDILDPSVPCTETIRRNRQFLQAEGRFLPSAEVEAERSKMVEVYRTEYS